MATSLSLTAWQRKVLIFSLLLSILGYFFVYENNKMRAPLVYLIPEQYFGPVFVFFGQADGVDTQPDPLGQAVWVPANGVVKIKAKVDDLDNHKRDGTQKTYWISVSKTGARKRLTTHGNTQKNSDGELYDFFIDQNNVTHTFIHEQKKGRYHYFSAEQKNAQMIFGIDGCQHQEFTAENEVNTSAPECAKFLVISPKENIALPDWMWDETHRPYSSIGEFEAEANERLKRKIEFYNLR